MKYWVQIKNNKFIGEDTLNNLLADNKEQKYGLNHIVNHDARQSYTDEAKTR